MKINKGHNNEISQIVKSHTGKYYATRSSSKIKIWDSQNKALLKTINLSELGISRNNNSIYNIEFSPDGRYLGIGFDIYFVLYNYSEDKWSNRFNLNNKYSQEEKYENIKNRRFIQLTRFAHFYDAVSILLYEEESFKNSFKLRLYSYNLNTKVRKLIKEFKDSNKIEFYTQNTNKDVVISKRDKNGFSFFDSNFELFDRIDLDSVDSGQSFANKDLVLSTNLNYASLIFRNKILIKNLVSKKEIELQVDSLYKKTTYNSIGLFSDDELYFIKADFRKDLESVKVSFYDLTSQKLVNEIDKKIEPQFSNVFTNLIEIDGRIVLTDRNNLYFTSKNSRQLSDEIKNMPQKLAEFFVQDSILYAGFEQSLVGKFNLSNFDFKLNKLSNENINIRDIQLLDSTLFVLGYNYNFKKRKYQNKLYKLNANDLSKVDSTSFFDKAIYRSIYFDKSEQFVAVSNNNLFKISDLTEIPVFEDQVYDNIYYTGEGRFIIGYLAEKGSYVFDANNYRFIKFIPNKLYFQNKEEEVVLSFSKDNLIVDNGISNVTIKPRKNFLDLLEHGLVSFNVFHNNSEVILRKNGHKTFALNLDKLNYDFYNEGKDLDLVKTEANKALYFSNSFTEKNTLEDCCQLLVSESSQMENPIALKLSGLIDLKYLNNQFILVKRLYKEIPESVKLTKKAHLEALDYSWDILKINYENPLSSEIVNNANGTIHFTFYDDRKPVVDLNNMVFGRNIKENKLTKLFLENIVRNDESDYNLPLDEYYDYSSITNLDSLYQWKKSAMYYHKYNLGYNQKLNAVTFHHPDKTTPKAELILNGSNEFMVVYEDGYYSATRSLFDYLFFEDDRTIFRPEQYDLKYNRPDIVLDRLGYSDSLTVQSYTKVYRKRLKKMGFTEIDLEKKFSLPEIEIINKSDLPSVTETKEMILRISTEDNNYTIDKLNVWINDTPIFGTQGIDVSSLDSKSLQKDITLELARGNNKIQVSSLNSKGIESLKRTVFMECTEGKIKPDLYFISIGLSSHKDKSFDLNYATKDAKDILAQFEESENFNSIYSKLILDKDVTIKNIKSIGNFLKTSDIDDIVIVFYAGHGVLDNNLNYYLASHNMNFDKPAKKGIPFDFLESQLNDISPLKKIMFIDACHSGELDDEEITFSTINEGTVIKARGSDSYNLKSDSNSNYNNILSFSKMLFSDLRRGNGTSIISSAGGLELAFEGDKWQNGLFTYCLLKGLYNREADLNNDGDVMLSELRRYLYSEVSQLSEGKQGPTSRMENISLDYKVW